MRRERVPEQVWIHAHAHDLTASPVRRAGLHRASTQALATAADEQSCFVWFCDRDTFLQPLLQGAGGLCSDGNDSLFVAFADDTYRAVGKVEAAHVQADEFGETQPGGVEQLHDRAIASDEDIARGYLEEPPHLIGIERLGKAPLRFGRSYLVSRVVLDVCRAGRALLRALLLDGFPHEKLKETTNSGEPTLDAARRKPFGV